MENTAAVAVGVKGWMQSISSALRIDWLEKKMHLSRGSLIEFIICFAFGILIGYLTKRYAKLILAAVCFVAILVVLQHFNFISIGINWGKLQGLSASPVSEPAGLFSVLWDWVKMHVGVVLSFAIGFLAGFRIS
jgi:uncharacterized membrane protein (Fun14 family)